jgi:hypothetical protein
VPLSSRRGTWLFGAAAITVAASCSLDTESTAARVDASSGAPGTAGAGGGLGGAGAVGGEAGSGGAGTSGQGGTAGQGLDAAAGAAGQAGATGGAGGQPPLDCTLFPGGKSFNVQGEVHCYWVGAGALPWAQARDACASDKGHLVTIHSQEENDFVRSLAEGDLWTGLRQVPGETSCDKSTFGWITGEPAGPDLWHSGEPNCVETYPFAARITDTGSWFDHSRSFPHGFVCEAGPKLE